MEAVDQLASAGTFRVVKEPLAFLRVLEWDVYVLYCFYLAYLAETQGIN